MRLGILMASSQVLNFFSSTFLYYVHIIIWSKKNSNTYSINFMKIKIVLSSLFTYFVGKHISGFDGDFLNEC